MSVIKPSLWIICDNKLNIGGSFWAKEIKLIYMIIFQFFKQEAQDEKLFKKAEDSIRNISELNTVEFKFDIIKLRKRVLKNIISLCSYIKDVNLAYQDELRTHNVKQKVDDFMSKFQVSYEDSAMAIWIITVINHI